MKSRTISLFWIGIYSILILVQLIGGVYLFELLGLILILYLIRNCDSKGVFLIGLSGLFHAIGTMPYVDLYALYTNYDVFTHFLGFFFATKGVLEIYSKENKAILFFSIVGIGTFMEIGEFLGYVILGYGHGGLMFGSGDFNLFLGAWSDSVTDQIANACGVFMAILLDYISKGKE